MLLSFGGHVVQGHQCGRNVLKNLMAEAKREKEQGFGRYADVYFGLTKGSVQKVPVRVLCEAKKL